MKSAYNKLLQVFISKSGNIQYFNNLFDYVSSRGYDLDYKRFQFVKVLYLLSDVFYDELCKERKFQFSEFFIILFEYFIGDSPLRFLNDKEIKKVVAICIRVIFEFPINENFYLNKPLPPEARKKLNAMSIKNVKNEVDNKINKLHRTHCRTRTYSMGLNSLQDNQLFSFEHSRSEDKLFEKEKENFHKYIDYETFDKFFNKVCFMQFKHSDCTLRSILLTLFEINNGINISKFTKYSFISKIKSKKSFYHYEYIITISYYNKIVHTYIFQILKLFELNNATLTEISYELILFLLLQICRNRPVNKCVFNHFVSYKGICHHIFTRAFINCRPATIQFMIHLEELFNLILPFHRCSFIYELLYNILIMKENMALGQIILDKLIDTNFPDEQKNSKYYFYNKINIVCLLYRLSKENNFYLEGSLNKTNKHISSLFSEQLVYTKLNIPEIDKANANLLGRFTNKNLFFTEMLFNLFIRQSLNSRNTEYLYLLRNLFLTYEGKTHESKERTLCGHYDKFYYSPERKNLQVNKFFPKVSKVDVPCFSLFFLTKTLKYFHKSEISEMRNIFKELSAALYLDVLRLFTKIKETREIIKEKIFKVSLYNNLNKDFIKKNIKEVSNGYEILGISDEYINMYKSKKEKNKHDGILSIIEGIIPHNKLEESFHSCNSTRSQRNYCKKNKDRKFINENKKTEDFNHHKEIEFPNVDNMLDEEDLKSSQSKKQRRSIFSFSIFGQKQNDNGEERNNPFDIHKVKYEDEVVMFPLNLIRKTFSAYFHDILFMNSDFVKMKKYYKYYYENIDNNKIEQNISIDNFIDFPSTIKNYTPKELFFKGIFLRNDFDFFTDHFFLISHPYFNDKIKGLKSQRIFEKKSLDMSILPLIGKDFKDSYTFHCELITNKNVVFGKLILSSDFIYFHNTNKAEFLKLKNDKEQEKYLLCSLDIDNSNRTKQLFIFIRNIHHIFNRRFLYQYQACEIFMKNGKSYFINFFNDEDKSKFFNELRHNASHVNIIENPRETFKEQHYKRLWLDGTLSNLEYLLLINKYAARSFNDYNQYPVFPWLYTFDNFTRDLGYTTLAQTEKQREILIKKYEDALAFEVTNNPSHYNTHYSNGPFVIFYLLRQNPFTNNQITLQCDQFDSPNRQFHSMKELLNILNNKDSRELIPQFYLTTEFLFNYNCNFFGFRTRDGKIIHNILDLDAQNPFEHVASQLDELNSDKTRAQLNKFIDIVFGVGQIGTKENCNAYHKYCYEELVNLKDKIDKYIEKKIPFDELKLKIDSKINQIISFGQTPSRLFNINHPVFSKEEESDPLEKISQLLDEEMEKEINVKSNVKFIKWTKDEENVYYIWFLEYTEPICQFEFFDIRMNQSDIKPIKIDKYFKFLQKVKLFKKEYYYKNSLRFIAIDFNLNIFVVCRFIDNSFILLSRKGESRAYLTHSFVTSLERTGKRKFMTGHVSGRIVEWKFIRKNVAFDYKEEMIKIKRSLQAHREEISGIYKCDKLGIIITTGMDGLIHVRKYFDFELMCTIRIYEEICIEIKVMNCFLYALMFDENKKFHYVRVYSLNGVLEKNFEPELMINRIVFTEKGNLLVGLMKEKRIDIYSSSFLLKKGSIDVGENECEDNIGKSSLFIDFDYIEGIGCVICAFSNGTITKKKVKLPNGI